MNTKPVPKKPINITLSGEAQELLLTLARTQGVSRSVIVELLIREEVKRKLAGIHSEE